MPAAMRMQKAKVKRNLPRILGTSSKKVELSTSFAVAPQDMSMEKRCERMAWETCMERPPMKMAMRGSHCEVISSYSLGVFLLLGSRDGEDVP